MSARAPRTPAGLVFRPAMDDLDAIAAIERGRSPIRGPASFAALLDREHVHFLVATRGGPVIAFVVAYAAADEAEIANLAVATERAADRALAPLLDASAVGT